MKLTTGKKLGLGFGIVLALMIVSAVLTSIKAGALKQGQNRVMAVRVPTVRAITDLQRDLNQTQSKGRQAVLAGAESARWEAAKKLFDSTWGDIGKDVAKLDELSSRWALQSNRDALAEAKTQLTALRDAQETAMKHATGSEHDAVSRAGNEFADKATPANEAIKTAIGQISDSNDKLLQEETEHMDAETRSMNITMAVATSVGVLIGIIVAFFIIRDISAAAKREKLAADEVAQGAERERIAAQDLTHKVDSILSVVSAAGQGDLTQEIQVRGSDAIGQMGEGLAKFFADLRGSIGSIGASAMNLASASEELTTVSQQMSANAEETSAQTKVVSGRDRAGQSEPANRSHRRGRNGRQYQGDRQERHRSR